MCLGFLEITINIVQKHSKSLMLVVWDCFNCSVSYTLIKATILLTQSLLICQSLIHQIYTQCSCTNTTSVLCSPKSVQHILGNSHAQHSQIKSMIGHTDCNHKYNQNVYKRTKQVKLKIPDYPQVLGVPALWLWTQQVNLLSMWPCYSPYSTRQVSNDIYHISSHRICVYYYLFQCLTVGVLFFLFKGLCIRGHFVFFPMKSYIGISLN